MNIESETAVEFLEHLYGRPYSQFKGDPTPVTAITLEQTLNDVQQRFGDKVIVVAPHIDSDGGVYEGLKEYGQLRIAALRHSALKALSFNKPETRERVADLFRQPEYKRGDTVALIQSSDFHGAPGAVIGQPRTEISAPSGKASFNNIRSALSDPKRVKCSVDFAREDYEKSTKGRFVSKFGSTSGQLLFREEDYGGVANAACAMLNSDGGLLDLDGAVNPQDEREKYWTRVRDQLQLILASRVEPPLESFEYRDFRFSPGRVRILIRVPRTDRLHTSEGLIYVVSDSRIKRASPAETEYIVGKMLMRRFGRRFEGTLEAISERSNLLSRLPRGIPLLLACGDKLEFGLPSQVEMEIIEPALTKGKDAMERVGELRERLETSPFGVSKGNTSLIFQFGKLQPPRDEEHYLRFTTLRIELDKETIEKCASGTTTSEGIIVLPGGGTGLVEPGAIISDSPAVLLKFSGEWQKRVHSLLAWFKSSFFIWYCAVRLGDTDFSFHLQVSRARIPFPGKETGDLYDRLGQHASNLVLDEKKFMDEVYREGKKASSHLEELEKEAKRFNERAHQYGLAIDEDVSKCLGLSETESRFIARTLRDLRMTDYGYLSQFET